MSLGAGVADEERSIKIDLGAIAKEILGTGTAMRSYYTVLRLEW
jgi:hypothetical protein